MKVSIIIPNFNGETILKDNFTSVINALSDFADKENVCEIIYVDDGSTDGSVSLLEKLSSSFIHKYISFQLIKKEKNSGFSSTVNTGAKKARGEILVLLNTDVRPKKDFLAPLLSHFENEKVFAVGSLDESIENGKIVKRGRGIGRWQKGFLMHSAGELHRTHILWVSGGSGAFRRSIWEKIGELNELYDPFYWEDIDLSYRALKAGYMLIFEPKSIVIHEHEKGAVQSSSSKELVKQTAYRNQFLFVWLNITAPVYLLQHLLWLPYHLISAIRRSDISFVKGFYQAIQLLPRVMEKRKKLKKVFVRSDRDILQSYKL